MTDDQIRAALKRRLFEHTGPPTDDEQRRFRQGFSGNDPTPKSEPDAAYWFGMKSVLPLDAAKVLFRCNPHDDNCDLATIATDETGPEDFTRLLDAFEDLERAHPKPRTLHQWYDHAVERTLIFPSWIDEFVPIEPNEPVMDTVKVDGGGAESSEEETAQKGQSVQAASVPNPFADFLALSNLSASEVSIEFAAGDSGGAILNVTARHVTRRIALAELDLFDRRKGDMNIKGAVMLKWATGERVSADSRKGMPKQIERLRKELKSRLGITDEPIVHNGGTGYEPAFKIQDKRGAADQRAKREAERRTVSLDELQESGIQFEGNERAECDHESEGDAADEWLRKNAG